jgi:hypothetical protein
MKFSYLFFLNPSVIQFDNPLCKNCKYYKYDSSNHIYGKCKVFEIKNVVTNEITLEDATIARKKYCGLSGIYYIPSDIKYPDLTRVGLLHVSQAI